MQSIRNTPTRNLRGHPKHGALHGSFGIIVGDYCQELKNVLAVAKAKGYQLPTKFQLNCLDAYIKELISAGIWSKIDVIYNFGYNSLLSDGLFSVTGNPLTSRPKHTLEKFCCINLKNPLLYECSIILSTSNSGYPRYTRRGSIMYSGGVTDGYLETGFAPGVGPNWVQNNAGIRCYVSSISSPGAQNNPTPAFIRDNANLRRSGLIINNSVGGSTGNINTTSFGSDTYETGVSSCIGYHNLERSASNLTTYYRDGISRGSNTRASTTVDTVTTFRVGTGVNIGGGLGYPLAMIAFGASLGATLQKIDFDIYTSFKNKLGIP